MLSLLLLAGCLERVTGEPQPLDPRFYEGVEDQQGTPEQGGGSAVPFSDYEGETVVVRGVVTAGIAGAVDIDVRVPDPGSPGGIAGKGKLLLEGPGPFELTVPRSLGRLELQAFQDPGSDGPNGQDPFASAWIEVGDGDLAGVELVLVPGARGDAGGGQGGPVHTPAPAGAPGGGGDPMASAPPGAPGGAPAAPGGNPDPFANASGARVALRGALTCDGCAVIDLDLYQPDPRAQGGRKMLGKLKLPPGNYEIKVPAGFGPLTLEAFVDAANDGPSPGDLMGVYAKNPVTVGQQDVAGVDIALSRTADGRMPNAPVQEQPPPPPQNPRKEGGI